MPWWFPAKTDQGAMRQDRLVLPIPPGLHWSDPMPVLKSETPEAPRERKRKQIESPKIGEIASPLAPTPRPRQGVRLGPPPDPSATPPAPVAPPAATEQPKPAKPARPKEKIDPAMVAKARELRDRYLEQVNDRLLLAPRGKYDVSRLPSAPVSELPRLAG